MVLAGVRCRGDEATLLDCHHDQTTWCPGAGAEEVAAVVCTDTQARHVLSCHVMSCHVMSSCVMSCHLVSCIMWQADLVPDLGELMRSAYLEDKPLYLLQCAMEENCLAGEVTMRSP